MAAKKGYNIQGKTDYCQLCGKGFDEIPYFSKNFHRGCYQINYGKIKRDYEKKREKEKGNKIKEYNLKKMIQPIIYTKRKHTPKEKPTPRILETKCKIENQAMLISFKENVKKRGGWIEWWEGYTLCHLFETYYPLASTYLDGKPIENQLILMWHWLKDYEY